MPNRRPFRNYTSRAADGEYAHAPRATPGPHATQVADAAVDGTQDSFQWSFKTMIDPVVLLRPIRDAAGVIVDFAYEDANDAACDENELPRETLVGMRVLGPRAHAVVTGLFDLYANVFDTGDPLSLDDFAYLDYRDEPPTQRFFHVRAGRAGGLLALTWRDVSGRHTAEVEQSRLATIVRSSPDAIVSTDHELRVTTWNRGAEIIYGYAAEEVLGRSAAFLLPLDAALPDGNVHEPPVAAAGVRRYETQRLRHDGTLIDVAITDFPLLDVMGEVNGTVSITRDITRQRHAALQLARSDARYGEILDTTPDGVWRVDADGRTDYVNPRMASMLGYSRDAMIGQELSEFTSPDWLASARDEMARARRDGRPAVSEHWWARHDGEWCWTRVSHTAIADKEGRYVGSLAIVSDITASKAQGVELRETERFLAALTDSMAEGMFALNREGRVTFMNQAAERLLGWTKDELATRSMHETTHYQRDDGSFHPAADSLLLGALRTGTTIQVDDDAFTRRDGRLLPVTYSAAPISIDGQVRGIVVVFGDVTARRTEEQRRKRELETLSWVGRIRDALDQDRLVLHAQPIIELRSRGVAGHELLVRMVAPDGGIIPPGRFLPAAEQFGLVEEIDRWVLAQAAKLAARGTKVQFNVSGKSLGSRALISDLVRLLRDTGVRPGLLVCELTETALANDEASAEAFVRELTALGCEIALDDFGMGYGGFAYLKRLPVSVLKIDSEFVRDLVESRENQHVVKAIVHLAQGFGRKTIAEGVENEPTLALLEEYGVDYAQGYHIGRPAPLDAVPLTAVQQFQSPDAAREQAA